MLYKLYAIDNVKLFQTELSAMEII